MHVLHLKEIKQMRVKKGSFCVMSSLNKIGQIFTSKCTLVDLLGHVTMLKRKLYHQKAPVGSFGFLVFS